MNKKKLDLFDRYAVLGLIAVMSAFGASARTVYDAGKALRENCTAASGAYANPYGVWSYHLANNAGVIKTTATLSSTNGRRAFSSVGSGTIDGFSIGTAQAGSIRTIVSGASIATVGEPLEVDELFMFPENHEDKFPMVRFTAPVAGWYSALVSAHDLAKDATASVNSGVRVRVFAQGNAIIHWIVSLEDYAASNPTHRFDFQMPVRHLAAGETIDVVVDRNGAHSNDPTGVKFIVTKEDEGMFYDSGIAMTNCVANAATYENPYGTIKDGSWYFLTTTVPSADADLAALAPGNFSRMSSSRISTKGTLSGGLVGFGTANGTSIKSPYVMANNTAAYSSSSLAAPCELQAHPTGADNKQWTTIRFRPPVAGYYSASVVARHVNNGTGAYDYTGVDVYLLASEHVVTNAYVFMKDFCATARLTFDARLFAAGEPVDVVIAPHGDQHSDATAVSAIFRREDVGVYDAGKSYYDVHAFRSASEYFSDSFDSTANWLLAMKADPWAEAHSSLMTYLTPSGTKLTWWTHATGNSNNGTAPRFAMSTNGIASVDSLYLTTSPLLATTPYELVVQPQSPTSADRGSASLRAEVPSNGIYRVRSYARDLNQNSGDAYDGVRVIVSANSYAPASAIVSRDNGASYSYEAALSADRLWMKQGEALYFTVDPRSSSSSDATALSACYEIADDAADAPRVINIDITGSDDRYVGVGREGWSDWTRWNGIRFSSKLPATDERTKQNCREADGTTHRNVSFTLKRDSGGNIDKGWSPTGYTGPTLLRIWAKSTGPSDTYTFKLSKLKANEPYTLYLYSSKGTDGSGNAVDGNAKFTIGGVAKTADEMWNMRDAKVLARFEVVSDANGEIAGTFAAGDADTSTLADSLQGGAFCGLTLVGEFPDYVPTGTAISIR